MSSLEVLTGSPYLSYSGMESWLTCGERFRLEKVVKVPRTDAWFFIGGSAVHKATEMLDLQQTNDPNEAWGVAWADGLATVDDMSKVRAGGRESKEWPNRENHEWWAVNGLDMVVKYHAERRRMDDEGWKVLAVEHGWELDIDGLLLRGFIDRVLTNPNGELELWDLKSGSHKPASSLQLGVYALGVGDTFGYQPIIGRYFMTRKADRGEQISLMHYTRERIAEWFGKARTGIESEIFVPHVTALCGSCSVAQFCVAVGGTPPASEQSK